MIVVRSDHPSANIVSIDTSVAAAMPGVLGAWTGDDLAVDGIGAIPWEDWPPVSSAFPKDAPPPAGDPGVAAPQPVLARGKVRFQGEPIAIVVADSIDRARDAAERIEVAYAPLDAVFDARRASAPDAAQVWDQFPGNQCFEIQTGDPQNASAVFGRAARVVRLSVDVPRLIQNPIEPRNYVGAWNAADGRYTLHAAAGKPQAVGRTLARAIFGISREQVRVIAQDVGGGFGSKNVLYPEQALVLWASRKAGRPVRWLGSRSENFLSDVQGRDQCADVELALDAGGKILGLRAHVLSNLGAYLGPKGAIPAMIVSKILTSVYEVPVIDLNVRAVYTNTPPTGPYRGAGTPEAIIIIERLMEAASRELGIPPAEFRRRNLIPASAMPCRTILGVVYDSGDFAAAMAAAEHAADVAGFAARRRDSARRGKLRGLGYANMIEWAGIGLPEKAEVSCTPDGAVTVRIGTMSNGQSHETVYAQLLADALGIELTRIRVLQGDSDQTPEGLGTGASRSMTISGSALLLAAQRLIETGRALASEMLEVALADVVFGDGAYTICGTDRRVRLEEAASKAVAEGADPEHGLAVAARYTPLDSTCPNGCHIAEVEVDPDSGAVSVLGYSIAQDVGRALNPLVVEGQLVGGVTQGIGQALLERAVFDPDSGQLLSGSFMDYALPRADHVPSFKVSLLEVPCEHTPMGMKSCGEIGATGGPAATINAVQDALWSVGVKHVPMPATPHNVRRAIEAAQAWPLKDTSEAG